MNSPALGPKEISSETVVYNKRIQQAASFVKIKKDSRPKIGLILGSGLDKVSDAIKESVVIPYKEIPHFATATVHKGNLILGKLFGEEVVVMQGRIHFYEGYKMHEVVFPLRVMKELGIETLIVSNSCGTMNKNFEPHNFMLIKDHINLIGNPLIGPNLEIYGERFCDLSFAYDDNYKKMMKESAKKKNINLYEGVYVAVTGPSYETPAEINFFSKIGGDSIGMSTVPEVIVARHMNIKVMGLAFLSNWAAGLSPVLLSDDDVRIAGLKGQDILLQLLEGFFSELNKQ